jgi:hypothetical protein
VRSRRRVRGAAGGTELWASMAGRDRGGAHAAEMWCKPGPPMRCLEAARNFAGGRGGGGCAWRGANPIELDSTRRKKAAMRRVTSSALYS